MENKHVGAFERSTLHQEGEIQELMGNIPNRIGRYGLYFIILIMVILGVITSYIQYPVTILTEATFQFNETTTRISKNRNVSAILHDYKAKTINSGDRVRIKLHKYPTQKFGYLEGRILDSKMMQGNTVSIQIALDQMTSNKNYHFIFTNKQPGVCEIISNRESLLERIISSITLK